MLLRYFYDERLAHASYLVGCQATGEAIVVDPMRNIQPYLQVADQEGLRIVGALETHIHADFVTGSRELAAKLDSTLYLSDEGDQDWKYQNLESVNHKLLKDRDTFKIGNLLFEVMHTPGHTPESISFLLTDKGGSADKPMGMFTGDFVFVGDVGRPDLLEKAAGMKGTSEEGAKQMFRSLKKFRNLPDYLQVWPAHGAGSACGKALGAIPSTTVGYEKQFNWALQIEDEPIFIQTLLEGQPEPPKYFAVMKSVNKIGPKLLQENPELSRINSNQELSELIQSGKQVLDTRDADSFADGHLPGTINIPFDKSFTNWAGWLIDYHKPLYILISREDALDELLISLHSVGIDYIVGYGLIGQFLEGNTSLESYVNVTPTEVYEQIKNKEVYLIDVRNRSEWNDGHIDGAQHIMLGTLPDRRNEILTDKPIIVQCGSGVRSAIGASILQANGMENVYNLLGGYTRWVRDINE